MPWNPIASYRDYVDRKKDSLRRRGENVSSFELERIILRFEDIKEVAVIGVKMPDEIDESIKAFVIVDNPEQFRIADLVTFLARELPITPCRSCWSLLPSCRAMLQAG